MSTKTAAKTATKPGTKTAAKTAPKTVAKTVAKSAAKPVAAKPAAAKPVAAKPPIAAKPAIAARPANTQPQAAPNRKANTRVSTSGKSQAGALTREALATDIAAFKKAGGRIEVLGHTPLRPTASPRSTTKSPAQPVARTAERVS